MSRYGLPGMITVSIRATDVNGRPTGVDLTSGITNGDTLPTGTVGGWREIALTEYTLSPNTQYAIVCRALNGSPWSTYVIWREVSAGTYPGGCEEYSADSGGTWYAAGGGIYDFMFEVWGNPLAPSFPIAHITELKVRGKQLDGSMRIFDILAGDTPNAVPGVNNLLFKGIIPLPFESSDIVIRNDGIVTGKIFLRIIDDADTQLYYGEVEANPGAHLFHNDILLEMPLHSHTLTIEAGSGETVQESIRINGNTEKEVKGWL